MRSVKMVGSGLNQVFVPVSFLGTSRSTFIFVVVCAHSVGGYCVSIRWRST